MNERMTGAQVQKLLFGSKPARNPNPMPRTGGPLPSGPAKSKAQRDAQPENQVEALISGFLRLRRWIVTRQQVGTFVPYWVAAKLQEGEHVNIGANVVRVGAKDDPDWLCRRPVIGSPGTVELFYLEVKGPKKEPSDGQITKIRELKALGFQAVWFDNLDAFKRWYVSVYGE